jgi:hypothetical protein
LGDLRSSDRISSDGRPAWHIVIPPVLFGGILASAAALGLLGSLLPARIAPRASPVRGWGASNERRRNRHL